MESLHLSFGSAQTGVVFEDRCPLLPIDSPNQRQMTGTRDLIMYGMVLNLARRPGLNKFPDYLKIHCHGFTCLFSRIVLRTSRKSLLKLRFCVHMNYLTANATPRRPHPSISLVRIVRK
jgi:hypothetical protein